MELILELKFFLRKFIFKLQDMADNRVSGRWPPTLAADSNYEAWKKDVQMWCHLTELPATKQALAIHLVLSGRARDASSELEIKELEKEDGVKKLLEKLHKLFLPEKGHRQFTAFNNLYNLCRMTDSKISDFVSEFEHIYFKFKSESMSLPDPVLALMLLASCNLSEQDHHLVMSAIPEVSYDNMRNAILRIFGHSLVREGASSTLTRSEVKIEPVFMENNSAGEVFYTRGRFRFGSRRTGGRGRQRAGVPRSSVDSRGRKLNPLGPDGQVSKCVVCKSILHWARDCPHDTERSKFGDVSGAESEVNFSMFVGCASSEVNDKLNSLVSESSGCAILDCGCSRTVCGEFWLQNFVSNMSDFERSLIREQPSSQSFTFGDGKTVMSSKRVTIPCWMGGLRGEVTTDVVPCNIPLLLSRNSMKIAGMVLDFKNDKVNFAQSGRGIDLRVTASGHYALPLTL